MKGAEREEPTASFWDSFNEFVRESGVQNNWMDATYEKFASTKRHLEDFVSDIKSIITSARDSAIRSVDFERVKMYWK